MAYCTQADLLKFIAPAALAELTTEVGDVPDADVVAEAIARADAEIDAYLGKRYTLPLAEVPARVRSLSVDLAIYHLFTRRGLADEVRRQRYEDGLAFLRDVAAGRAELQELGGNEPAGDVQEVIEVSSQPRRFDRDKLSGW